MSDNGEGSAEAYTTKKSKSVQPQLRLELSVCQDGSLVTAPLSTILNAATDSLYRDLHTMTYDELTDIPLTAASQAEDHTSNANNVAASSMTATRKEKMASLSFLRRRVQLSSTLARHSKSISHITALVASYLPQSASANGTSSSSVTSHRSSRRKFNVASRHPSNAVPNEFELTEITQLVSNALAHVHKTWVNADEAQDALFVYHGTLWHSRNHPHDVLGAMEVLTGNGGGCWTDLPKDIDLALDDYSVSVEKGYSPTETVERLQSIVRRKMVLGEIAMCGKAQNPTNNPFQWKMLLEQNGTVLRLTYGKPYRSTSSIRSQVNYPIEARVTILSEQTDMLPPWTLLSIRVRISPKTGESNHQLELSSDQMFRFHKLCALAMNQEEKSSHGTGATKKRVARPLAKLLDMSHIFSISWQMDILSCQADALRKGSWSSGSSSAIESGIEVTPVNFLEFDQDNANGNFSRTKDDGDNITRPLATLAIHFWSVDDRYGSPKLGNLAEPTQEAQSLSRPLDSNTSAMINPTAPDKSGKSGRLTLEIRAVARVGLEVSLSGGNSVMNILQKDAHDESANTKHLRRSVKKLLSSLRNPFQLSTSDALLSATVICAEQRCHAVVAALHRAQDSGLLDQASILPPWLHLSVECGSICIAASLSYDIKDSQGESHESGQTQRSPVLVFRLACDSRTGRYIASFPRSASLIRKLACNDATASEVQLLRQAKFAQNARRRNVAGRDLTGRVVRDAFENLTRSIDTLGRRVGVGEDWVDVGKDKIALREKAIMQSVKDARNSLMICAGMSAVFGVGALAIGVASGINAVVDMAGGPVKLDKTCSLLDVPPLSIITHQQMVERNTINGNGENETETSMRIERELCGVCCSISHEKLTLRLLDISTRLESAMAVTERIHCELLPIEPGIDIEEYAQTKKKSRLDNNGSSMDTDLSQSCKINSMFAEVQYFASCLNATWNKTMHD